MDNFLKSGEAAKRLAVSNNTIRRWVYRYPHYFSEDARASNRPHSIYTSDDFKILVTIHHLSVAGYSLEAIEQKLEEGFRYEGTDDKIPALPSNLSEAKSVRTLEGILQQVLEQNNILMADLTETKYKLGVAEGKLEALKEMYRK